MTHRQSYMLLNWLLVARKRLNKKLNKAYRSAHNLKISLQLDDGLIIN